MVKREKRVVVDIPEDWVIDLDESAEYAGKCRADILRDAIREYLDRDRLNRIEDDIDEIADRLARVEDTLETDDSHTHKAGGGMQQASPSVEKAREMIRTLQSRHDGPGIQTDDVDRAIGDIAGSDSRTLRKYKRIFRDRGLLFEHPGDSPVWTLDGEMWLNWIEQYATFEGPDAAETEADKYGPVTAHTTGGTLDVELAEVEQ